MIRFVSLFVLIMFILSACNQNENQTMEGKSDDGNSMIPLTTDEEEPLSPMEAEAEELEVAHPPGYGVPHIEPSKQRDVEQQSGPQINQLDENTKFHLPFNDFTERWNALTQEQGTNLELSSLEKVTNNDQIFYRGSLNKSLEIRVFARNDIVQKMVLPASGTSNTNLSRMLAVWTQMVYMMNPEAQPHQIDELFNEFGIGPNLDFTKVVEKTIEQEGIKYIVIPVNEGFQFEASYLEA